MQIHVCVLQRPVLIIRLTLMPKNGIIYVGVLVVAASALLWLSKLILDYVDYALPYAAAIGIILIVVGVFMEARKGKQALKPSSDEATSIKDTTL